MNKLLQMLDKVRPEVEPLDGHCIADEEPLNRDRYLGLLATNLLELGALSEARSRLFDMLIAVTNSSQPASFYMQQATALTHDELRETLLFLQTHEDIAKAFLFDLMVLLRIDGPISIATAELLGQQFSILLFDEDDAKLHMFWLSYLTQGRVETSILNGIENDDIKVICAEHIARSDSDILSQYNCKNISFKVGDFIGEGSVNVGCHLETYTGSYNYHYYVNKLTFPSGIVLEKYPSPINIKGYFWSDGGQHNPAMKIIPIPDWVDTWINW